MTAAVTVIMIEVTSSLDVLAPIILSCIVARFVAQYLVGHNLDERLILAKGVPFLEHDAHPSTASASAVVSLIARSDPRAFAAAVNAVVLPPGHPRDPAALLPAVSQRVRQDQPEARVLRHRPLPPVDAAAAAAEEDEEEGDASSLVAS